MDEAWVNLRLVDANDNAPTFASSHAHLTLPEDMPTGTLLTTFTAYDKDGVSVDLVPVCDETVRVVWLCCALRSAAQLKAGVNIDVP